MQARAGIVQCGPGQLAVSDILRDVLADQEGHQFTTGHQPPRHRHRAGLDHRARGACQRRLDALGHDAQFQVGRHLYQRLIKALLLPRAFAQDLTPVTIGWGAYPDVPQIAQAADKKLWAAQKLDAKKIPFANGRAGFEALIGGQRDYVVMAEFPGVAGVMRPT